MKTLIIRGFMALAVTFSLFSLAACNTVEGAGKDIQSAGESIEDAAENNRNY